MDKTDIVRDCRSLIERLNSNIALLASEHAVEVQIYLQTLSVQCIGPARVPLRKMTATFVQEL